MAEAIFTAIDSATLNYTDIHPEQMFRYVYNKKEDVMQYTESSNISTLFEGTTGKGHVSMRVLFGITPKGCNSRYREQFLRSQGVVNTQGVRKW